MKYNFCLLVIIIIVLALIFHIYQIESPEQFQISQNLEQFENNDTTSANSIFEMIPKTTENNTDIQNTNITSNNANTTDQTSLINEQELQEKNLKTIQRLADKLKAVNIKMAEFDKVKPVRSSVYANLFENQLPAYYKKNRKASNITNMAYDVSQQVQDLRLKNIETKISKLDEKADKTQGEQVTKLGSIKSHLYGKTLNLIHNSNDTYTIPINNGCLFIINNDSGEVDYDITNFSRNDKNKICLPEEPNQQFIIKRINDLDGYKQIMGASIDEEPLDSEYITYPFYVVQPSNNDKHCLEIGHDGIHFEKCNHKKAQRWEGNKNIKPCN